MKLRIKGNSLRLRLTRSEVATLGSGGRVAETVMFAPQNILTYIVESANIAAITADYTGAQILIRVPAEGATRLSESDEVGLSSEQAIGENLKLTIIIEKDFTCLTPRGDEDADTFHHPQQSTHAC